MRDTIEKYALRSVPRWQVNNPRLRQLALFDQYLDGTIYKNLPYEFYQDVKFDDVHINFYKRKPNVKFNLARLASTSIARKLFAGRHAPTLILDNPDSLKKIQDLLNSSNLESEMINLVTRGAVGSVCALFRIVATDDGPQLVIDVERAIDCYPRFDAAKELVELRIIKEVGGYWFLDNGVVADNKGEAIDPKKKYWLIKKIDKIEEVHFKPIQINLWNPYSDQTAQVVRIAEGTLGPVEHELKMVPAQWFLNMSGGEFPDGGCLFEPALENIITYDFGMSQLWLGLMNSACPITVISGRLLEFKGEDGKPIPRSPSRVLQFESTTKDDDGLMEEGGTAKFLETNGMGFTAGQAYYRQIKKDAAEQICSSRKDPDKVTTSMSGKGMELVEEEFTDLVMELRTSYGQNGYLKLVKKIVRAAIRAKHPLVSGLTEQEVQKLMLSWPDLHEMSAQEQQLFTQSLEQGQEAGVVDQQQAADIYRGKMDIPQTSRKLPKKKPKPKSSSNQGR